MLIIASLSFQRILGCMRRINAGRWMIADRGASVAKMILREVRPAGKDAGAIRICIGQRHVASMLTISSTPQSELAVFYIDYFYYFFLNSTVVS